MTQYLLPSSKKSKGRFFPSTSVKFGMSESPAPRYHLQGVSAQTLLMPVSKS